MSQSRSPVLYIPHGGGPLPLLGEPSHRAMVEFLEKIPSRLGKPKAILMVSAHWETEQPALTAAAQPQLIYDYYGFPPESYSIQYPAVGDPALAKRTYELLKAAGFNAQQDEQRGFDHGMFVPLKSMYPQADIPVVQLSLLQSLDAGLHIDMGRALAPLRDEGVLIIGSGMSFHNMKAFHHGVDSEQNGWLLAFDAWLRETCTSADLSVQERNERLARWLEQAPYARYNHPREEHLLPLQVCFGAALAQTPQAETVFHDTVMGKMVSALLWE